MKLDKLEHYAKRCRVERMVGVYMGPFATVDVLKSMGASVRLPLPGELAVFD
jgi:hypothetical protein